MTASCPHSLAQFDPIDCSPTPGDRRVCVAALCTIACGRQLLRCGSDRAIAPNSKSIANSVRWADGGRATHFHRGRFMICFIRRLTSGARRRRTAARRGSLSSLIQRRSFSVNQRRSDRSIYQHYWRELISIDRGAYCRCPLPVFPPYPSQSAVQRALIYPFVARAKRAKSRVLVAAAELSLDAIRFTFSPFVFRSHCVWAPIGR